MSCLFFLSIYVKAHEFLFLHLTAETDKFDDLHCVAKVNEKVLKYKIK